MDKLVIIAGPTASGKSAAGIELAKRLNGSIISADSMQVYKHLDIGSAKVTPEEMQGIPHYLVDRIEPSEEWNVVRFQQEAMKAAAEIAAQERLPIVVGGTGFYIQALLYQIDFTETNEDTAFRKEMEAKAAAEGPESLYNELQKVDPEGAAAIHPNNVKRVIRALEYARETGGKISDHNREERQKPAAYDAVFFCLTMDRQKLYSRIDRRVDAMMEAGLLREVQNLRGMGYTEKDVSMQGLGYKQLLQYLDGRYTLEQAVAEIKTQTRHFAKRQLTWFRREKNVTWINRDDYASEEEMISFMESAIQNHFRGV